MHVMNHNWSAMKQRDKPPFRFVRGQDSTTWNIVWVSPQGHRSVSVSQRFLLQALQCPCSVQKWFSRDHCADEGQNPVARLWGRTTFRHQDILPPGRFAPGRFAPWTFRPLTGRFAPDCGRFAPISGLFVPAC